MYSVVLLIGGQEAQRWNVETYENAKSAAELAMQYPQPVASEVRIVYSPPPPPSTTVRRWRFNGNQWVLMSLANLLRRLFG